MDFTVFKAEMARNNKMLELTALREMDGFDDEEEEGDEEVDDEEEEEESIF
jgi:hypothetical protein